MDIHNGCADEGISIIGVRHEPAAALEQALVQRLPLQQLSQAAPESSLFDVEPERLSKVPGQLDFVAVMFFLQLPVDELNTCMPALESPAASFMSSRNSFTNREASISSNLKNWRSA